MVEFWRVFGRPKGRHWEFSGSAWVCTKAHTANGPTVDHTCWRLWIKRGKDGKDAR